MAWLASGAPQTMARVLPPVLALLTAVHAVAAIVQKLTGTPRPASTFLNPNHLAAWLAAVMLFLAGQALGRSAAASERWVYGGASLLALSGHPRDRLTRRCARAGRGCGGARRRDVGRDDEAHAAGAITAAIVAGAGDERDDRGALPRRSRPLFVSSIENLGRVDPYARGIAASRERSRAIPDGGVQLQVPDRRGAAALRAGVPHAAFRRAALRVRVRATRRCRRPGRSRARLLSHVSRGGAA